MKLLRDGEPVENVKLDESNKWTHTWTALDADHEWTVVEAAVPDGYTTISDVEGDSTEITNTHTPPTTGPAAHRRRRAAGRLDCRGHLGRGLGAADRCQDGFAEAGVA